MPEKERELVGNEKEEDPEDWADWPGSWGWGMLRRRVWELGTCRGQFEGPQLRVEGNSTPLQYSCLENPVDGGA